MTTSVGAERLVQHLFEAALDQPTRGRRAFLRDACDDERVIREVEDLLAFDEAEHDFLDTPVVHLDADSNDLGSRLGPFVLRRKIGQGGTSRVYLAERSRGEPRRVAVKLLHEHLARTPVLRRFRKEQRILARLRHPNIATFLHGGTSRDGLPYVVMEYVPGQPITQYCDARRLTVEERLALFLSVCAAVGHAHGHRVIHRDLKPSNVLVTDDGVVKLLDFGIAKVVGPSLLFPVSEETATRDRFLTPDYASPEHVAGDMVTAASDVFSLGVVLYEMLTGVLPFSNALRSHLNLGDAPPPLDRAVSTTLCAAERSPRLVAALRSTASRQLRDELSGELGRVVLRAMSFEPAERQASVDELSREIRSSLGESRGHDSRGHATGLGGRLREITKWLQPNGGGGW